MERLRRKKIFTKSEKEEITKKMIKGYQKLSETDNELFQKSSSFGDEAK